MQNLSFYSDRIPPVSLLRLPSFFNTDKGIAPFMAGFFFTPLLHPCIPVSHNSCAYIDPLSWFQSVIIIIITPPKVLYTIPFLEAIMMRERAFMKLFIVRFFEKFMSFEEKSQKMWRIGAK